MKFDADKESRSKLESTSEGRPRTLEIRNEIRKNAQMNQRKSKTTSNEVGEQLAETSWKICGMQVEKTIIQQRQIQHTKRHILNKTNEILLKWRIIVAKIL